MYVRCASFCANFGPDWLNWPEMVTSCAEDSGQRTLSRRCVLGETTHCSAGGLPHCLNQRDTTQTVRGRCERDVPRLVVGLWHHHPLHGSSASAYAERRLMSSSGIECWSDGIKGESNTRGHLPVISGSSLSRFCDDINTQRDARHDAAHTSVVGSSTPVLRRPQCSRSTRNDCRSITEDAQWIGATGCSAW